MCVATVRTYNMYTLDLHIQCRYVTAHLFSLAMALSVLTLKDALLRTLTRLTEQAN